jgi:hypothetical protein
METDLLQYGYLFILNKGCFLLGELIEMTDNSDEYIDSESFTADLLDPRHHDTL